MLVKIKTALISVSDKSGLDILAKELDKNNVKIISTGGTYKYIKDLGIDVVEISQHTNFPEMMDGRVKTLHPKIHGGLLALRDNDAHVKSMNDHDIEAIDLVVVNLYPFVETIAKNPSYEQAIEQIDIGGPSMVRSAAKNHKFTTIVTKASDYDSLINELNNNDGKVSYEFRKKCASEAFKLTSIYDTAISNWFEKQFESDQKDNNDFADNLSLNYTKQESLRYGENPHQNAAFYSDGSNSGIASAKQLQGKPLSYNNIHDADAALQLVKEFKEPACVIIKHANPCGAAIAENISIAFDKALKCDPVSAFGGIIAVNKQIDEELANKISKMFVEVIIAPEVSDEAKEIFALKKNLRVLVLSNLNSKQAFSYKSVEGGILVQDNDNNDLDNEELVLVSQRKSTENENIDLLFAMKICKHVKSNAIVLVKDGATVGIGAGQVSRVDSVKLAGLKMQEHRSDVTDCVLASDAFFPFADGVTEAAKVKVKAIIQPGGSVRDGEVVEEANKHNMAMVTTGTRHFRH